LAPAVLELIAVAQEWFYAEDGRSVGPLSFDALTAALRRKAEPDRMLVWHAGLDDWRPASKVPELAGRIGKQIETAPPVASPDPTMDRWTSNEAAAEVWDEDDAPTKRWPVIAAIVVLALIVVAGAVYASRILWKAGEVESRVVLPVEPAPQPQGSQQPQSPRPQPPKQEAVKQDPAVVLAQLTEKAAQAAAATDAIAQKLWASIEPAGMQAPPSYATASRSELENYFVELETAEANATAAGAQYAALLKAERDLVEEAARTSGLSESEWTNLLKDVDDRHSATLDLAKQMLEARGNLYRARQRVQAIVIDQFGKFKVVGDGQIRFSTKAMTDRMVAAAEQERAADKALDRIEERMMSARQVPQQSSEPAWKDMITKDRVAPQQ